MSNILNYSIKGEFEGVKIREYLKEQQKLSTRFIRTAARDRRIGVNGKSVPPSYLLKAGDEIQVKIDKVESQNIEPEKMNIEVAYEDNDIIVVNKPPGVIVHPTKRYTSGTLSNGILYYFKEKGENCIVRLVSRLDMDTSGLIMVAKNQFAHMALARDMQSTNFEKSYMAVVHGNLKCKKGIIDEPIYLNEEETIKTRIVHEKGQKSVTHYESLEAYNKSELVKLTLETGRTHQIRVHLSHIGNPIFGDSLYGREEPEYIRRQALHAYRLCFPHPRTGKILTLETELPEDIKELLVKLKNE